MDQIDVLHTKTNGSFILSYSTRMYCLQHKTHMCTDGQMLSPPMSPSRGTQGSQQGTHAELLREEHPP